MKSRLNNFQKKMSSQETWENGKLEQSAYGIYREKYLQMIVVPTKLVLNTSE
jgi:hypothetical protein